MAMIQKISLSTILLLVISTFLVSCSLSEGEARITMCQKVVQELLEVKEIEWREQHEKTEALSNITVSLLFDVHEQSKEHDEHTDTLTAVCVYAYNDIAEYDVVGHEYEDSPTDIFINDKMVGRLSLTEAASKVMLNAAKGIF